MTWTKVSGGYEIGLLKGKVACRNSAGKPLRSVPAGLKNDPAVVGLRQLLQWLARHEAACQADVETWMVRSLPVPLAVLLQLWPDPSWQRVLRDLVVRPDGVTGADVGLLRDVDAVRGAGLVTLDGDTIWVRATRLSVPHPVLLPDLDDLRGFVVDLGVEQVVPQLFRETWTRPADADLAAISLNDWSGGRFLEARHLTGRVTSQGYAVRGGYATLKIFEDAVPVEARFWVGSEYSDEEAETGELGWVDRGSRSVALGDVGPVAWSEGVRMAARIYAGRVTDEETAA